MKAEKDDYYKHKQMIGTLTLTHLGWFVTSSENPFGYPLYYLDLQALAFRSDIKLDDRHGQAVDFVLIDLTSPITRETVSYASITKLYDETLKPLTQKLRDHIKSITTEQFEKEIDEIIAEGYTASPTMEEFICEMEDCPHCAYEQQQEYEEELEKDACIEFAKWLAQDWMSIWVGDKWMWECQTDGVHLGPYKTEEELYQIYLKSI